MRTVITLFAVLAICLLQASVALAHPPSDIEMSLDNKTHVLTVTALHQVHDYKSHYINQMTVWLDKDQVITQKFSSQTDNTKQFAQYIILDAKPGSVIKVIATCNRGGTLEKTYKVK